MVLNIDLNKEELYLEDLYYILNLGSNLHIVEKNEFLKSFFSILLDHYSQFNIKIDYLESINSILFEMFYNNADVNSYNDNRLQIKLDEYVDKVLNSNMVKTLINDLRDKLNYKSYYVLNTNIKFIKGKVILTSILEEE